MPKQFLRTFLSTLATTTLTALHSCLTNSASAAPVQALSADSFVDSIAVGVHLTYEDTPYAIFRSPDQTIRCN